MNILEKYREYPRESELTQAEEIVLSIVDEMTGRRGIGNSFEECDDDIQEEMLETWINIVNEKL
jgi:hypothetical protein